jgi:hypothetical protein
VQPTSVVKERIVQHPVRYGYHQRAVKGVQIKLSVVHHNALQGLYLCFYYSAHSVAVQSHIVRQVAVTVCAGGLWERVWCVGVVEA